MPTLSIHLFGQLRIDTFNGESCIIKHGRGQELLGYLLLRSPHTLSREALASVFWADSSTSKALKNLRQLLWQVRSDLGAARAEPELLLVGAEGISINHEADFWLDVAHFRQVASQVEGVAGHALSDAQVAELQAVIKLYSADLLESCHNDWCIYEREYLQRLLIILLDKLIGYCQKQRCYEVGIQYGERLLRYDRAHERTHRRLMYLHYLAGDRTAALRQFLRCHDALREELDVEPTHSTVALNEQIRADRVPVGPAASSPNSELSLALNRPS